MADSVVAQVVALQRMSRPKLKERWQVLMGFEAPKHLKQKDLVARLAYRVQELAYGGLSQTTRDRLEEVATQTPIKGASPPPDTPPTGTRLVREWNGVRHEVAVLSDGFEWQGKPYKSLSAIARAITGTRWNGPAFFGLRRKKKG